VTALALTTFVTALGFAINCNFRNRNPTAVSQNRHKLPSFSSNTNLRLSIDKTTSRTTNEDELLAFNAVPCILYSIVLRDLFSINADPYQITTAAMHLIANPQLSVAH
jgi:hypothetical protein